MFSGWSILILFALVALGAGVWVLGQWLWLHQQVSGDAYFSKPLATRRAIRREIQQRARCMVPAAWLLGRLLGCRPPSVSVRGVRFPVPNCSRRTVERAISFRPDSRDVLVVTQMRSGTTWMQQLVFQILCRGKGSLADEGHRHMNALSAWLESCTSVTVDRAARLGDQGQRIIKTHLPASLCPFSEEARYLYVARHPVACFASARDFIETVYGPISYRGEEFVDWFCSDRMWWGPWPAHVGGWWRRAEERRNVLFIRFEEMLADLPGAIARVAGFLEVELTPEEAADVARMSSYAFMKEMEEHLEMAPPSFLSVPEGTFFRSGRADRGQSVNEDVRRRIMEHCTEHARRYGYPIAKFYPDLGRSS